MIHSMKKNPVAPGIENAGVEEEMLSKYGSQKRLHC